MTKTIIANKLIDACRELAEMTDNEQLIGLIDELIFSLQRQCFDGVNASLNAAMRVANEAEKAALDDLASDCVCLFTRANEIAGISATDWQPSWPCK